MAYRSGNIINADPAALLITQIEAALLDQCGLAWTAATAYGGAGQTLFVRGLASGVYYRFEATTAGTSHATTEPTWSTATTVGNTITDGTVTWTNRGRATWEAVETVNISSIDYKIWKNRGATAANPNRFGTDFYIAINRVAATQIRFKAFESWDATNDKIIRPVQGKTSLAVNANGSYGDETNGYTADNTANLTYAGFTALATTGFDYGIQATRDQLRMFIKQSTSDAFVSMGVFESLLTTSPTETFPLYMSHPGSSTIADHNFVAATVQYALSRHPGISSATNTDNLKGSGQFTALGPLLGGVDIAATVDKAHNNAWITQRPSVQFYGGLTSSAPQTYGQYRGLIYDAILLANNGASTRNGDVQTLDTTDAYVKFAIAANSAWWAKREAV